MNALGIVLYAAMRVSVQQVLVDQVVGNADVGAVQLELEPFSIKSVHLGLSFRKEGMYHYDGYGAGLYLSRSWPCNERDRLVTRFGMRFLVPTENYSYSTWTENSGYEVVSRRSVHILQTIDPPILRGQSDAHNATALGFTPGLFLEHRLFGAVRVRAGMEGFIARFAMQRAQWSPKAGRLLTTTDETSFKLVLSPSFSLGF